jgi:hypothetical protein
MMLVWSGLKIARLGRLVGLKHLRFIRIQLVIRDDTDCLFML